MWKENWYAFCLCIFKDITVDDSLRRFGLRQNSKYSRKYSDDFINKIVSFRHQGMSFKEI